MSEAELIDRCTNVLPGHGPRLSTKHWLQEIAEALTDEEMPDRYGEGQAIAAFEKEVAELFEKDAAVFMPSGTMAQQIALRLWCEQTRNFTVAMHPSAHLEFAEQGSYQFLHGIKRLQFGTPEFLAERMLSAKDFEELGTLPGTVLLELPYRPLGGPLPHWEDLVATRDWALAHAIPIHLDGARIWQCRPFYGKSYAEIAALFDSIYVSFYKDIGALPGCMLLGPAPFIAAARIWQRRYGGVVYTQAPAVVSARERMKVVLPQIDTWVARAKEIAAVFASCPGVRVSPNPPAANFFQLFLEGDPDSLVRRHNELAEKTGTFLFSALRASAVPGIAMTELHIFENGLKFDLAGLRAFLYELMQ